MSRARALSPAIPSVLACIGLASCGASPATRYYTLQSVMPAGAAPSLPGSPAVKPITVRLEPVVIPPELDRLELVSRLGRYRVRISDTDRWAAPLDDQIRRVLSEDLAERLPPHWVADPNEPTGNDPRRLLSIAIADFYADEVCRTTLRADWTLRGPSGLSERGTEQVQQPGVAPCDGAVPAGMSSALGQLADRLAGVILAPPSGASVP
jgi:uncharacterized lipoprotein YmbA